MIWLSRSDWLKSDLSPTESSSSDWPMKTYLEPNDLVVGLWLTQVRFEPDRMNGLWLTEKICLESTNQVVRLLLTQENIEPDRIVGLWLTEKHIQSPMICCRVGSFIMQRCRRKRPSMFLKRSFGYENNARKSFRSIVGDFAFPPFCYFFRSKNS